MLTPLLNLGASALYLGVGGLLFKRLAANEPGPAGRGTATAVLATAAVILHALVLYSTVAQEGQINLGFTGATSLITWAIALLFVVASTRSPIENLGVLVMPAAGLAVIAAWLWPGSQRVITAPTPIFNLHLVISILAYAFLTLALVQAVLLSVQERRLRRHHPGRLLRALPPIQTMERLLFQLISTGFALLTLTLVSGILFTEQIFGAPLVFNHHTVLSILAWLIFGTLLLGHWRLGWRGRNAVRWTVGGFITLVLAYLGTKFVIEYLLR